MANSDPVTKLSEEHRPALTRLLEGAMRGRDLETYAIRSLNGDLLEAAAEGDQVHVEKFSNKIRAHKLTLENRTADFIALTAAIAAIPKEDEQ